MFRMLSRVRSLSGGLRLATKMRRPSAAVRSLSMHDTPKHTVLMSSPKRYNHHKSGSTAQTVVQLESKEKPKEVIIAGATSGIGNFTAKLFAESGYRVTAIGRNTEELAKLKTSYPSNVVTVAADLTDAESSRRISESFGPSTQIKYVVNAAATAEPFAPLTKVSISDLTKSIGLNAIAPIILIQCLSPYLPPGSRYLSIGSSYVDPRTTFDPNLAGSYAMGKTANYIAMRYLRAETRGKPLIGYLNPGATLTPMYKAFMREMDRKGVVQQDWKPTNPADIALFIKDVLENTSDEKYSGLDWDFENKLHRDRSNYFIDNPSALSKAQATSATSSGVPCENSIFFKDHNPKIKLKVLDPSDNLNIFRELCIKTYKQTYLNEYTEIGLGKGFDQDYIDHQLPSELKSKDVIYIVASIHGKLTGYAKLRYTENTAILDKLYLLNNYQRLGIGKMLLGECCKLALTRNQKRMELFVWENNKNAISFYEKNGFVLGEKSTKYFGNQQFVVYNMVIHDIHQALKNGTCYQPPLLRSG